MKRKRYESTAISNKILCLQNGSNVEVQLDDGKWFVYHREEKKNNIYSFFFLKAFGNYYSMSTKKISCSS